MVICKTYYKQRSFGTWVGNILYVQQVLVRYFMEATVFRLRWELIRVQCHKSFCQRVCESVCC